GSQRFEAALTRPSAHTAGRESTAAEVMTELWKRLQAWCDEQTQASLREGSVRTGVLNTPRSPSDRHTVPASHPHPPTPSPSHEGEGESSAPRKLISEFDRLTPRLIAINSHD